MRITESTYRIFGSATERYGFRAFALPRRSSSQPALLSTAIS
jgi:hypothetical protein